MRPWLKVALMIVANAVNLAGQGSAAETLTNRSVIAMVAAGLPEDVVVQQINGSQAKFDVSTNGLVELGRAKVPAAVIRAMVARANGGAGPTISASPAGGAPATGGIAGLPDAPTEPGIYLEHRTARGPERVPLEPTAYTAGKTGGVIQSRLTYGIAKVSYKAVVRSPAAVITTADGKPSFLFVFPKSKDDPAAGQFNTATSPNEFTLVKFTEKGDRRELVISQGNAFGQSSGTQDKAVVPFVFERIRTGLYRVTPKDILEVGEYGFLSSSGFQVAVVGMVGAAGSPKVFDFSVR